MKLVSIKKLVSVACAVAVAATLAACGGSAPAPAASSAAEAVSEAASEAESAVEEAAEAVEEAAEEAAEAAEETAEAAEEAAATVEAPANEMPTDDLEPISNYPAKSLQITCPPSAGGGTDVLLRAMAPAMEKYLGVPVTVVNKSGGGCAIGYAAGAVDPADGSCITAGVAELLGLPYTTDFQYTYHDFEPICNFNSCYGTICVPVNAPYNTIEEFNEYLKSTPGVRFANSGIGGPWHILAAAYCDSLGLSVDDVVHVPCDGGGPAATACAGGNVEVVNVSDTEVKTYVESGLLKMLLTFSPVRLEMFPDVPTANEKGLQGSQIVVFRGFLGPKGMPEEAIKAVDAATRYALTDPTVVEFMKNNGYTNNYMNAEDFYGMLEGMDAVIAEQCDKLGLSK